MVNLMCVKNKVEVDYAARMTMSILVEIISFKTEQRQYRLTGKPSSDLDELKIGASGIGNSSTIPATWHRLLYHDERRGV